MADWFRRKTWTERDELEFFAKLSRARKDGRAQYLKIQAIELIETKEKGLLQVAESLLNKVLTEYPDDSFNKSSSLHNLGEIYKLNDDFDMALMYYKHALDFENIYPQVRTQAYLDYCELVVKTDKKDLFNDAERILEMEINSQPFPIVKYKLYSLLSIINMSKGNSLVAKQYADLAEQNATAETSGLRYHKYLGIVKERDNWLERLMRGK